MVLASLRIVVKKKIRFVGAKVSAYVPGVAGKPQDAAIAIATHSPELIRPGCSRNDAVRIYADVRLHDGEGDRAAPENRASRGGLEIMLSHRTRAMALCGAARQRCAGRAMRARAALLAGTALVGASLALATGAQAQTVINVTVANDTGTTPAGATGGAGTLSAALAQVNASTPPGGFVINLQTNVTLSGPLSPIFNSVTINGNGFTISGNNSQRIFMVGVDTATQNSAGVAGSIIAQRPQVAINNVTLSNGLAQGGNSNGGGGLGAGAGGALFV